MCVNEVSILRGRHLNCLFVIVKLRFCTCIIFSQNKYFLTVIKSQTFGKSVVKIDMCSASRFRSHMLHRNYFRLVILILHIFQGFLLLTDFIAQQLYPNTFDMLNLFIFLRIQVYIYKILSQSIDYQLKLFVLTMYKYLLCLTVIAIECPIHFRMV